VSFDYAVARVAGKLEDQITDARSKKDGAMIVKQMMTDLTLRARKERIDGAQ